MEFLRVLFLHFELVPKCTLSIFKLPISSVKLVHQAYDKYFWGTNEYIFQGKRLSYSDLQGIWA